MQTAQPAQSRAKSNIPTGSRRRSHQRPGPALWVVLGALVVLIPLVLICCAIITFQVMQWNLPGVTIFDQSVGMMSYDDTVEWIDSYWNQARLITLQNPDDPDFSYIVIPADLGYWVDPTATADAAYAIGRDSTPFEEITAALWGQPQTVLPVMYFDESLARQTLETLSTDLTIPATEASVAYQDGEWVAVGGATGQGLDLDATLQNVYVNAFPILLTQSVALTMQETPPAISDLTPVIGEIEALISQDLTLTAYDPITDDRTVWSVPAEIKRNWVAVDPVSYAISLDIDPDDLPALLDNWKESLSEDASLSFDVNPSEIVEDWQNGLDPIVIVQHAPTTYRVSAGESLWAISLKLGMPMWRIMDANEGLTTSNIEAGMLLTIPSKNDLLPLPVIPNKRIVVVISSQRMTVYEDGEVRNIYVVSTGIASSPTMAGVFQVQTHEINAYASNWDLYMPHFMGIYEAWPGFMNGIHGLPLLSSGTRLWASSLGSPASYGCIILDLGAAEDLYDWAEDGVVIEITP
ncbi:L,D-transpeptidase family protein [Chloroflexota bacterium]|nr:L,D-transpeptidase family protein [Chloroflexota bacterium]